MSHYLLGTVENLSLSCQLPELGVSPWNCPIAVPSFGGQFLKALMVTGGDINSLIDVSGYDQLGHPTT